MSFTFFDYEAQSLFTPPSTAYVVKVVESADADDMSTRVQAALDEVTALNVEIDAAFPQTPNLLLTLCDVNLAGGGDGHTFICTLFFVPDGANSLETLLNNGTPQPLAFVPGAFRFRFGLAGERDALESQILATIASVIPTVDTVTIFQDIAGSAKGTRFMYMVGGLPEQG